MYPVIRLAKEFIKYRKAPALTLGDIHVSHHMCLPWDIDLWMELNNGRTLTLYDLGRLILAKRSGLLAAIKDAGLQMTDLSTSQSSLEEIFVGLVKENA